MKIIFLDYDGVINTLCFQDVNGEPNFNYPQQSQVNNMQAVAWLNKLCRETGAKIVVTSTWRLADNYKDCLYNAGLNKNIEILGRTDKLHAFEARRGDEIQKWIDDNPDIQIEQFVILDDDSDMKHLIKHLVKTDSMLGLTYYEYDKALEMLKYGLRYGQKKIWFKKLKTKIQEHRYKNYIYEHQQNILTAFQEMCMCPNLYNTIIGDEPKIYDNLLKRIEVHDESKYKKAEFDAYRKNFYPICKEEKENNLEDFNKAWKHHYEVNDHHWQNRQNNDEELTLDRKCAILENVCDWLAMGYKFKDRPYQYYERNKEDIILPKADKEFLEEVIYKLDKGVKND